MLKLIKNERVIMCDIDDTLVMHGNDKQITDAKYVSIIDPIDACNRILLRVNEPMCRLVQEELTRGSQVCFWSRGGYQWAANVVDALWMSDHLDTDGYECLVLTKPFAYFDDTPVDKWMNDRVYLTPDTVYKK